MNEGAKQGLIWGLVLTGVGVGIYFLVKKIGEDTNLLDKDREVEEDEDTGEGGSKTNPSAADKVMLDAGVADKVMLDADKWVKKGDNGVEVKYVQWGVNNIIKAAKQVDREPYRSPAKDKSRIAAIAAIKPLKRDGDFGNKTKAAVQIITGNSGTNYCLIQKKRLAFHAKYGGTIAGTVLLNNPYGNMKLCVDKMVSR